MVGMFYPNPTLSKVQTHKFREPTTVKEHVREPLFEDLLSPDHLFCNGQMHQTYSDKARSWAGLVPPN